MTRAAALALLAAACGTESVERCPSPFGEVSVTTNVELAPDTGTEVSCAGYDSFCANGTSWTVDVVGRCDRTVVSLCLAGNFAVFNCLELFLGTEADNVPAGALLVFEDDAGEGIDAVRQAVGGRIDLGSFTSTDLRGRFDLELDPGQVSGTFALPGPADAAP